MAEETTGAAGTNDPNAEKPVDNRMVAVELKEERAYRPEGSESEIYVGPGNVEVPRWVAEKWGLVEKEDPNAQTPPAGSTPPSEPDAPAVPRKK